MLSCSGMACMLNFSAPASTILRSRNVQTSMVCFIGIFFKQDSQDYFWGLVYRNISRHVKKFLDTYYCLGKNSCHSRVGGNPGIYWIQDNLITSRLREVTRQSNLFKFAGHPCAPSGKNRKDFSLTKFTTIFRKTRLQIIT